MSALDYFQSVSCIRFVPQTYHHPYSIVFEPGKGCSSHVGYQRIPYQNVIIDPKTCPTGRIIHEVLHALGFLHMHTIVGRDKYVKINWDNIKEAAKSNFEPYQAHVSLFGTEYDYDSIMHYSKFAFSKIKNSYTIIPLLEAPNMGQREGKK